MPVVAFVGAFGIGSVPFGYLIGRLFYRRDIRKHGSGNIGAMNALRTLGTAGAISVLLLDGLKGFVPVLWVANDQLVAAIVAAGAVLGHCFSPWLRLRGGKGVATSFGALLALCWPAGLVALAGWAVGAAVTRYSSVGSLLGSAVAPFAVYAFTRSLPETAYAVFAGLLIAFTHRENIGRLRAGTEGAIGRFKARA